MSENKITMKDVTRTYNRLWLVCEMTNSYERMMGVSYGYAMIPVLKKLYGHNKEDYSKALHRHLAFWNSEAVWGGSILGLSVAMEEELANGADFDPEAINGIKAGLMGPLAGIGDSINWATLKPIFFSLAASICASGTAAGIPIMFLLGIIMYFLGVNFCRMGYKFGQSGIQQMLESGLINQLMKGASILGLFMIGALSAEQVKFSLAPVWMSGGNEQTLQGVLDGVIPGLIPMLIVWAIFFYMKKRGEKIGRIVIAIVVICLLCGLVGLV